MTMVASTITEYHELIGEINGQIELLKRLHEKGIINQAQFEEELAPLRKQLEQITG